MSLRSSLLRIASGLPKGDSTRRKLLAALADKQAATRTEGAVHFFPDMDSGTVLVETQVHLPWMWKGGAAFGKELDAGVADNRTKFDSWLDKANQAIQALTPGHRTSISYYHNHDSVRTAQEKNVLIIKSEWSYKNPGSMYADEDAVRQALRESARKAGLAYDEA